LCDTCRKKTFEKEYKSKYFASSEREYHFPGLLVEFGLNRVATFQQDLFTTSNKDASKNSIYIALASNFSQTTLQAAPPPAS
jgi:hypothetical protein